MTGSHNAETDTARAARRVALALAGTGVFWIAVTWAGGAWGWPERLRALLDLFVLAGFGWCLWAIFGLWRQSRGK